MTLYTPASIDEPVEAVVNTIFDAARRGQLVVCAGAGLSLAMPSELPSGAELGRWLNERLEGLVAGYASPVTVPVGSCFTQHKEWQASPAEPSR